jgi:hypothetical protein
MNLRILTSTNSSIKHSAARFADTNADVAGWLLASSGIERTAKRRSGAKRIINYMISMSTIVAFSWSWCLLSLNVTTTEYLWQPWLCRLLPNSSGQMISVYCYTYSRLVNLNNLSLCLNHLARKGAKHFRLAKGEWLALGYRKAW